MWRSRLLHPKGDSPLADYPVLFSWGVAEMASLAEKAELIEPQTSGTSRAPQAREIATRKKNAI
jgi:hypothetical protein